MPPRGPLVRRGPETHAATKGRATSSTDVAAQVASPVGSYGRPGIAREPLHQPWAARTPLLLSSLGTARTPIFRGYAAWPCKPSM